MVLNRLWEAGGGLTSEGDVDEAVQMIVDVREFEYNDLFKSQNDASRRLLRAIAKEGAVEEPQSAAFIARARLGAASTVRSALRVLEANDLVYRSSRGYIVYDSFFGEWLARAWSF